MLGGHLDSWHRGTGATDNAAGVRRRRWRPCASSRRSTSSRGGRSASPSGRGEEQGLLGSKAYVAEHFGQLDADADGDARPRRPASTPAPPRRRPSRLPAGTAVDRKPEYEKFSRLLQPRQRHRQDPRRLPAGQRGRPPDLPQVARAVRRPGRHDADASPTPAAPTTCRSTRIGLPGFQFIQDPIEYRTRTHHSNQDVYDRIQADDLKQAVRRSWPPSSTTPRWRDEKLPRKPIDPSAAYDGRDVRKRAAATAAAPVAPVDSSG